ncbi:MAG: 5-(carboxyamino)imidazole ribonucleotide synthase [Pseudomonadota bacterium]
MSESHRQQTIGIIGGGQLGRMLAMAAARLGHLTTVLDPAENCPAAQACNQHIIAAYDDADALEKLAECDVVTYEFENVDAEAIRQLSAQTSVAPGVEPLKVSQDRLTEKEFLGQAGLKTADFRDISNEASLKKALFEFGGKGILKTRRFGYDGKGQVLFKGEDTDMSVAEALAAIQGAPAILEAFVPFEREISVIATRNESADCVCFEPAENVHVDGILHTSTVPASIAPEIAEAATAHARSLAHALNYVGTLGLEFFVLPDGSLIANEFAPRVHNSGHWTEAACAISQFDMHIRAITNAPLPRSFRHSNAVMTNLIGDEIHTVRDTANSGAVMVHDYGKIETRDGRKMGHYTTLSAKR